MIESNMWRLCFRCVILLAILWAVLGRASASSQRLARRLSLPSTKVDGTAGGGAAPALVFEGVTVIDVANGRRLPTQTVVVVGNRIRAVGASRKVRTPAGAQVVDARGKYLIPGLWDMHTHLYTWCSPEVSYRLFIAHGVTGVRDMGSPIPLDTLLRWRREIGAGQRVGPRLVVAGPLLEAPEGIPAVDSASCYHPLAVGVATPADGRRVVDSLKAAGADLIKLHGIGNGSPTSDTTRAIYFAIAAEARRLKIPFGGHAIIASPLEGSDSGQRSFEHYLPSPECSGDSARVEKCRPLAARFRRNGTWFVPTLAIVAERPSRSRTPAALRFVPRWVLPESLYAKVDVTMPPGPYSVPTNLRTDIAQQSGLPMLAGTDAPALGMMPGIALHDELATLVWAGMTPLAALQAATLNPAQYLNATDSLGTVAPGKLADLVLLDADPLVDINNTTRIRAVVANGRYFDRAALDTLLAEAEAAAKRRKHD